MSSCAAVEEGIVPGGGAAHLHLSEYLETFRDSVTDEEERIGVDIVIKALRAPCKQIAQNAGVDGEVVAEKLVGKPFEMGYNAMNDTYVDMLEAGVIDPAKVTRSGIQNACSIAAIMLTTEAVMVEAPEEEESALAALLNGGKKRKEKDNVGFNPSGMPAGLTI